MSIGTLDVTTMSAGLLVARVALGLAMAAHGSQKLLGWFGGYGLKGTGGFFEGLGFRPGVAFATAASVSEVVGGLLVTLGFLGPIGPALIIGVMIVAAVTVHLKNGFFASGNGFEVAYLYGAGAVALLLTGPGAYSVDALLGIGSLWTPAVVWGVLAVGIIGGFANLLLRRTVPTPVAAQH
jgi:putative oxidoreductase